MLICWKVSHAAASDAHELQTADEPFDQATAGSPSREVIEAAAQVDEVALAIQADSEGTHAPEEEFLPKVAQDSPESPVVKEPAGEDAQDGTEPQASEECVSSSGCEGEKASSGAAKRAFVADSDHELKGKRGRFNNSCNAEALT